jgi:hypothetical protein
VRLAVSTAPAYGPASALAAVDGTAVRLNDPPGAGLEFAPVDRDTFQRGMMIFRLQRDSTAAITGVQFTNPLLRSVTFARTR